MYESFCSRLNGDGFIAFFDDLLALRLSSALVLLEFGARGGSSSTLGVSLFLTFGSTASSRESAIDSRSPAISFNGDLEGAGDVSRRSLRACSSERVVAVRITVNRLFSWVCLRSVCERSERHVFLRKDILRGWCVVEDATNPNGKIQMRERKTEFRSSDVKLKFTQARSGFDSFTCLSSSPSLHNGGTLPSTSKNPS